MLNLLSRKYFLMGINLLIPIFVCAQNQNIPLNQTFFFNVEYKIQQSEEIIHSAFKPILKRDLKVDSICSVTALPRQLDKSWVARKLFHEHFVTLDTGIVKLTIDPLFNFEFGKDTEFDRRGDILLYKSMRGFNVKVQLGNKVAIESSFRENQAVLPLYLSDRTAKNQVAYGQGRVKTFGDNGYDFAMASAYVSYSPSQRLNVQFGHGKHFVGNGHRSLLLSDISFNYPFLKLNSNWFNGRLQYQNLYAVFQDLTRLESTSNSEGLFQRKQAAIHYLEFSPNSKFSIGLFENVVFPSLDTTGNVKKGVNYWIPLIGLNTIVEGNENKGNAIFGINTALKLGKKFSLYGQIAFTDENFKEPSLQIGGKLFAHKNIQFQGEINSIKGTSLSNLLQHYSESLTTPFVGEHIEAVGIATFKKNRWLSRGMINVFFEDIQDIKYLDFRQAYIVNPTFNFTVHAGIQLRNATLSSKNEFIILNPALLPSGLTNSTYIYFGLSTNLQNIFSNY